EGGRGGGRRVGGAGEAQGLEGPQHPPEDRRPRAREAARPRRRPQGAHALPQRQLGAGLRPLQGAAPAAALTGGAAEGEGRTRKLAIQPYRILQRNGIRADLIARRAIPPRAAGPWLGEESPL